MTQLNRFHRECARRVLHDFGDGWTVYYYPYGEGYGTEPCALVEDPMGISRDQSDELCCESCAEIWMESGARDWERMHEEYREAAEEAAAEDAAERQLEDRYIYGY